MPLGVPVGAVPLHQGRRRFLTSGTVAASVRYFVVSEKPAISGQPAISGELVVFEKFTTSEQPARSEEPAIPEQFAISGRPGTSDKLPSVTAGVLPAFDASSSFAAVSTKVDASLAPNKPVVKRPETSYGVASYYRQARTASGGKPNARDLTAAHRTLPFGTRVRVTNLSTGQSVTVRINDRGPFVRSRIVDVSYSAAEKLGLLGRGVAKVKLEVEPANASLQPYSEALWPPMAGA